MNTRFVIDTNTLIGAFLFPNSKPRQTFDQGKILVSPETFREFVEVFSRSKFDKYVSREERIVVIHEFSQQMAVVKSTETIKECRDPKDDKFLELAVAANASCLITGDEDLLVLHSFRNIPILNSSHFINHF